MAERVIHRHRCQGRRRHSSSRWEWLGLVFVIGLWVLVGAALGGLVTLIAIDALLTGRCW